MTVRRTGAFALCAVALAAYSQAPLGGERGQTQNQATQTNNQSADNKRGTDQAPLVVKIQTSEEAKTKATEDAKERREKAELDRKLVQFNGDLAHYTKVLAWVAGLQFLALFVQSIVLAFSLRHSAKSAWAATKTVKEMRKNATHELRAYISIEGVTILKDDPDFLRLQIQNTGRTPAKDLIGHLNYYSVGSVGEALPTDFAYTDFGVPGDGSRMSIGAGMRPAISFEIVKDRLEAARDGKRGLFIYGHVDYRDVFDRTWYANFCYEFMSFVPIGTDGQGKWTWRATKEHNNAT